MQQDPGSWAVPTPSPAPAAPAPVRPTTTLVPDDAQVAALVRAALATHLRRGGAWPLLLFPLAAGWSLGRLSPAPWLVGTVVAVGFAGLLVWSQHRQLRAGARRSWPAGQPMSSTRYADRLETSGHRGRTAYGPGSADRARRDGAVTLVRLRATRQSLMFPSALVTDDDLAFLLTPTGSTAPAGADPGLPHVVVVTPELRTAMTLATAGWSARRRGIGLFAGSFLAVLAVLTPAAITWAAAAMILLANLVMVLSLAVRTRRAYRPGVLARAGVSPEGVRYRIDGDQDTVVPWHQVRSCTTQRHVVRLGLLGGVVLFMPRALFPAAVLAELRERAAATTAP